MSRAKNENTNGRVKMANREKFVQGFEDKYVAALTEGISTEDFCDRYVAGGATAKNLQRLSQKLAQTRKSKAFAGVELPSLRAKNRVAKPSAFAKAIQAYHDGLQADAEKRAEVAAPATDAAPAPTAE